MSYILEALKKSERERSFNDIPILKTTPGQTRGGAWRAAFWVLLVAVLGVVAVAVYVGLDWASVPGAALLAPQDDTSFQRQPESRPVPSGNATPVRGPESAAALTDKATPAREVETEPASIVLEVAPPEPELAPAPGTESLAEPAAKAPAETVLQITGLPPELADVVVNVISYSTDSDRRFIMVGHRVLKEGDALPAGGVIDSISRDAVIVAYAGRQYRLQP